MAATASVDQSPELSSAAVAHLSRYRDTSREHTESDLRVFFTWCHDRQLAPLTAQRHDLELYLRWLQDVRRFKPSTVSRRLSVVAGFYRTCVIDGVLEHSPADYVRRPSVPPESPTLGLTHLQFEAMLTAARESTNPYDFALVCLLGLLRQLAAVAGVRLPRMHPHMLRHTFVTTMLDAGVDLRDVQIAARHADPRTTMRYDRAARTSTATRSTSSRPTWRRAHDPTLPMSAYAGSSDLRPHGLPQAAAKDENPGWGRLCSFPLGAREPELETDARGFPGTSNCCPVHASQRR